MKQGLCPRWSVIPEKAFWDNNHLTDEYLVIYVLMGDFFGCRVKLYPTHPSSFLIVRSIISAHSTPNSSCLLLYSLEFSEQHPRFYMPDTLSCPLHLPYKCPPSGLSSSLLCSSHSCTDVTFTPGSHPLCEWLRL